MPIPPISDVDKQDIHNILQDIHRIVGGINTKVERIGEELLQANEAIHSNTREIGELSVVTREYLVQAKETHFKQIEIQGEQAKLSKRLRKIEEIFQL